MSTVALIVPWSTPGSCWAKVKTSFQSRASRCDSSFGTVTERDHTQDLSHLLIGVRPLSVSDLDLAFELQPLRTVCEHVFGHGRLRPAQPVAAHRSARWRQAGPHGRARCARAGARA